MKKAFESNATGNQLVKRLQMSAAGNTQSGFLTILTTVKMNVAEILFLNPIRVSAVLKTNSKFAEIVKLYSFNLEQG